MSLWNRSYNLQVCGLVTTHPPIILEALKSGLKSSSVRPFFNTRLTGAILTTNWSSETNLKIVKDSYNRRLKSVVFDCWFDVFTASRIMAVAIKFHLRRNSGSVRRFGTLSCSVTTPMIKLKTVFVFQDKLWAELMLENYSISHKLRRSRTPL